MYTGRGPSRNDKQVPNPPNEWTTPFVSDGVIATSIDEVGLQFTNWGFFQYLIVSTVFTWHLAAYLTLSFRVDTIGIRY
ncbi:hypothetical protein BCR44DRAFT_43535 [Catenaria anguillulae PL171]|uniref:Uncharacterized protein n=1 Tax=Catenaria anguillulae PL171 TaxID=765915 RepID=A0A1Y2HKA2_9FUNG|nr:hypothetical protein BCR44DRAFT_43535 [Catenaria anguillulae PL171]